MADARDSCGVLVRQREVRADGARAIEKQLHRCITAHGVERVLARRVWCRQRRQWQRHLAGKVERFAARRKDRDAATGLQKIPCQLRAREHKMLAIVENEQGRAVLDESLQSFDDGPARLIRDPQCCGDRIGYEARIRNRREVHEPDAIGIRVDHGGSKLQRQTSLADASDPDQRHQPMVGQHRAQVD